MRLKHLLCLLSAVAGIFATENESYDELLRLKPLPNGKVLATFTFTTTTNDWSSPKTHSPSEQAHHYRLFPITLAQLLRQYSVSEFHLSLNAGKWNYAEWGTPDVSSAGGGAELWAWISSGHGGSIKKRWQGLTNGLSGLFCASLSSLDEKRTVTPVFAFRPEGVLSKDPAQELLYAYLPSENVCTENLTPFIKMLPCKARSGIAMLLNPHRIFDADWHGLSIHVTSPQTGVIQLRMAVSAVLDPVRTSHLALVKDWSLKSLFNERIASSCLAASSSQIQVHSPVNEPYTLTPAVDSTFDGITIFDIADVQVPFDVHMKYQNPYVQFEFVRATVPLLATRNLHGGLTDGKMTLQLENRNSTTLDVLWMETLPWFISLYLHTLNVTVDGFESRELLRILTYQTPNDLAQTSTLIEALVQIPPQSTVHISVDIGKASILYTEHPPDASRGWDLPPAIFTLPGRTRVYTSNLLAELPTPDFSMPYNVIIMTSTLVALFFGSVLNTVTRSFGWIPV